MHQNSISLKAFACTGTIGKNTKAEKSEIVLSGSAAGEGRAVRYLSLIESSDFRRNGIKIPADVVWQEAGRRKEKRRRNTSAIFSHLLKTETDQMDSPHNILKNGH